MKIFLNETVLDAARKRIAWLFDEFPNVVVNFSGGKDSCVVLNLTLEEAERRGRLPVPVHWIDQEAEWQATVDYTQSVMEDPRVLPRWFQMPMKIFNATSTIEPWLLCWNPADRERWMRDKWPGAIVDNPFGTDRFSELFPAILAHYYPNEPVASIGGVRAEESVRRTMAVTELATYKWVTWGTVQSKKLGHYNFYPIYDWGYQDVWKAIHQHGWSYCSIYDKMYQYGYPTRDMRVSNLHHETAIKHLRFLQEIEPHTWDRLTRRLRGINTVKHLQGTSMEAPKNLPPMFASWIEYRDYLLARLVTDPEARDAFAKKFASLDKRYEGMRSSEKRHKVEVSAILANDYEFTKILNWEASPMVGTWRKWKRGVNIPLTQLRNNPYING
jgi:predicted phosphoadenosine phosphosulfate sulfurtransferase